MAHIVVPLQDGYALWCDAVLTVDPARARTYTRAAGLRRMARARDQAAARDRRTRLSARTALVLSVIPHVAFLSCPEVGVLQIASAARNFPTWRGGSRVDRALRRRSWAIVLALRRRTLIKADVPTNARAIRSMRRSMKLTQQAFGSLLGLSFVSINRWEGGRSAPTGLSLVVFELLHKALARHPSSHVIATLRKAGGEQVDVVRTLVLLEAKVAC